ncbi:hypothetical protein ABL78_0724 [Leptomonas seymouri]|uniref:TATA element modulatory factor 1 TATA binding domain-containing protein n=1 Tax=Leptomonas seymouri TaxID=5684 RepID=A0A0N0P8Q0_LEPSE|nr:hypothetical protein ABL78_0724 [Leptomonas seymouri]|eukprot:KPI90206.1 hypothetical protein ABL78_0724 [Leptomonas seymouri]
MWSSFLDQIQQRIDEAADLLGDEEGEEVEEEESLHQHAHIQPNSGQTRRSSAPQGPSNNVLQATSVAAAHGGTQGWEEDDLKDLTPSTTAASPPPVLLPATAKSAEELEASEEAVSGTATVASDPVPAPGASSVADKVHKGVHEWGGETEVGTDTANSLRVSPRATLEAAAGVLAAAQLELPPASTVGESPTLPPSVSAGEHGASSSASVDSTDAPRPTTAAVPNASAEGNKKPEGHPKAEEFEELEVVEGRGEPSEDARVSVTQSVSTLANPAAVEQQSGASAEAASTCDEVSPSPSLPPSSKRVVEPGDEAQLLRFQQQLAVEMENVANLQKENLLLKGRVSALEDDLSSANARLAAGAGCEEQLSLLIERLGKEKERHRAAASERSRLEEHVQDLEEELEEYRVKEQGWIDGSEQQRQNEDAAQQHIAKLEREVRTQNSLTEDLNAKLRETTHQNSVLQHQVEELKAAYSTKLDTMRESNSDTVDQLRCEVEQLRSSLQNLSIEYDMRTAELEREVQRSNMRVHQAEARFSEVEFGSVNTLQDLRNELEDSQRSISTWKAEAQRTRSEYTELLDQYASLKRSRAAGDTDLRERLAAESATVAELREGIRNWEARYQALQETLRATQAESEDQRKTIMLLEAASQKPKTGAADNVLHSQSDVSSSSLTLTKGSSLEASPSALPFSSRPAGRAAAVGVPMHPFVKRECPVWNDSTDRKIRERLEQEVLRQSTELERLRQVAKESSEWKSKFLQLQTENDLLLQLYGQLEDDVTALKSTDGAAPPGSPPGVPVSSSTSQ